MHLLPSSPSIHNTINKYWHAKMATNYFLSCVHGLEIKGSVFLHPLILRSFGQWETRKET